MPKLLLIDDDNEYREMLKITLEKAGYEVWEASDGEEGINLCRKARFAVIISDLFMPQIDGVQTVFKMKKEFPSSKIISITGAEISSGRTTHLFELARQCGADEVYRKTDHINELLIKIRSLQ